MCDIDKNSVENAVEKYAFKDVESPCLKDWEKVLAFSKKFREYIVTYKHDTRYFYWDGYILSMTDKVHVIGVDKCQNGNIRNLLDYEKMFLKKNNFTFDDTPSNIEFGFVDYILPNMKPLKMILKSKFVVDVSLNYLVLGKDLKYDGNIVPLRLEEKMFALKNNLVIKETISAESKHIFRNSSLDVCQIVGTNIVVKYNLTNGKVKVWGHVENNKLVPLPIEKVSEKEIDTIVETGLISEEPLVIASPIELVQNKYKFIPRHFITEKENFIISIDGEYAIGRDLKNDGNLFPLTSHEIYCAKQSGYNYSELEVEKSFKMKEIQDIDTKIILLQQKLAN